MVDPVSGGDGRQHRVIPHTTVPMAPVTTRGFP
jgi:hypothetical protein